MERPIAECIRSCPGMVVRSCAGPANGLSAGGPILTFEAMDENTPEPYDGVVRKIFVKVGEFSRRMSSWPKSIAPGGKIRNSKSGNPKQILKIEKGFNRE